MSNTFVSEYVLKAPTFETEGKKIARTAKEIAEAEDKAAKATRALNSELSGGFSGLGQEARGVVSQVRQSSGAGGRKVASVGHMNWVLPQSDPAVTKTSTWLDTFAIAAKNNANKPGSLKNLGSDFASMFSGIRLRPNVDWSGAKKGASDFLDDLKGKMGDASAALNPLKAVGVGLGAFAATAAATGFSLMGQAAGFDSLRQSLVAIEGSAGGAEKALGRIKNLARAPGLGFEEAVQAYTGLRNADLDQGFSEELIKHLANANARGGGGAESFGRIMTQIRQAAGRPYLSQEDLVPIGEAGVPVNSLLRKRFGTGDTEELKAKGITATMALHGLVEELAKLPRVAGGAQNDIDNLFDAVKFAGVSAGDALNSSFLPLASDLAEAVQKLGEGGEISNAFNVAAENIRSIFDSDEEGMEGVLRELLVAVEDLSSAARNLVENGKGAVDFLKDALPVVVGPLGGKIVDAIGGGAPALTDEHAQHEATAAQAADLASKRRRNAKADEEMQKVGYKGDRNSWLKMPEQARKAMLDEADRKAKITGAESKGGDAKKDSAMERTARASETLVALKRREMDMASFASGGGELARMGITATELGGNRPDDIAKQIAGLLMKLGGIVAVDHSTRQARAGTGRF